MVLPVIGVFTVISAFLVMVVVSFGKKSGKKKTIPPEIINERVAAFKPKPLISEEAVKPLRGKTLEILQPDEKSPGCLNLAKVNYLNFLDSEYLKNKAAECIRSYGVGSCGPRGFYGTIDVHLRLESQIAEFLKVEEAVLYSYGFSTIASAVGAYCKKSDIIFCDEMINFACEQGYIAAKSTIVYFKHNDMEDLESKLKEYEIKEEKRKKLYRKFLIVEGIYASTGKICPLPQLMALREKYRLRIFIDESISFGVLGEYGRGVTEHFNVDRSEVDMIMGSLEGSVGSIGGFCAGASVIIEHQRLSGLGYCFSASLPPCLSEIAICAIKIFEEDNHLFKALKKVSMEINEQLNNLTYYKVLSDAESPLQVITTKESNSEEIDKIHLYCTQQNLHLIKQNGNLHLHASVNMTPETIKKIVSILGDAHNQI